MKPDTDIEFIEIQKEFSFGSWVIQMVAVYCLPSLVMAVIEDALGLKDTAGTLVAEYLTAMLAGWTLAHMVAYAADDATQEGSMVWVLPALLESILVLWSLVSGRFSELYGMFLTFGPGRGEESLGLVLITIPTVGCCAYSATMRHLASRNARKR